MCKSKLFNLFVNKINGSAVTVESNSKIFGDSFGKSNCIKIINTPQTIGFIFKGQQHVSYKHDVKYYVNKTGLHIIGKLSDVHLLPIDKRWYLR